MSSRPTKGNLRLLVDLTYLRHVEVGGSETYVAGVLEALMRRSVEFDLEIAVLGTKSALRAVGADVAPGVVRYTLPEPFELRRLGFAWILVSSTIGVFRASQFAADVVWAPGNFRALWSRRNHVITVHDLLHRNSPGLLDKWTVRFREFMFPRSCKTAARIIVLSERVRSDLVRHYPGETDRGAKIRLIDPGSDHVSHAEAGRIPQELLDRRLDVDNFLIYPAMFQPHKNHKLLLEAFGGACAGGATSHLVLTGAKAKDDVLAMLKETCRAQHVEDRVHFLPGHDVHADILTLIASARALVFPSTHEGYAITVAEAAALGTPAIVAQEIPAVAPFVDHMTVVASDDQEGWTAAILDLEQHDSGADAAAARAIAATMTWDSAAAATATIFHEAAGHGVQRRRKS